MSASAKAIINEIVDPAPVATANSENNAMQVPAASETKGSSEKTQADDARELTEEPPSFPLSEDDQEVNKKISEARAA